MAYALISPNQEVYDNNTTPPTALGYSIVQVEQQEFPIAQPLFWTSCDDTVIAYEYYYNPNNQQIIVIPPQPTPPPPPKGNGPTVA
jgi:hypothetical protein